MNGHKFCGHCGSEINTQEKFCGNCGAPIAAPTPIATSAPIAQGAPVAQPTPIAAPAPAIQSTPIATPKTKSKKPLIFATIAVLAVALISAATFAIVSNLPKSRTVMVYMIGSNLETDSSAGSLDIKEIIDSDYDPEFTKVLVYTGGAKAWALDEVSANENAVFEVSADGLKKVQTYDKKVMTSTDTLVEYLDFAYENYQSDLYDLILWDHGGGPIVGYGHDENSLTGKAMSLSDLTSAFSQSELIKSNKKFEIVGFDACLMGSIEVGTALSSYANFMIASEESEPGWGWNYDFLKEIDGKTKSEDFGKSVVEYFLKHYDDYPYEVDLSLAMMDLSKLEKVAASADKLFDSVNGAINANTFSEYSRTMTRSHIYGYNGRDSESFDLVDLSDLASGLEGKHPSEVTALQSAVKDAIVYADTNLESTNGISIYFPTTNKANLEKLLSRYESVAYSDNYYKFLKKYANFITGTRVVSRGTYSDLEEKTDGKAVSVELPDELVDNFQKAEIVIYRKLGDNKYSPVYRGSNATLDGKTLKTDNTNLQFVVSYHDAKDKIDSNGWIALFEKARTDSYTDYTSFGVLYYNDDSHLGFAPKSYEMHLRLRNGEKVAEVRDIRVQADKDTGLSGKISFEPEKIKIIDMVVGTYKLFDDKGNRLNEVESWGQLYGTSLNLEEGDTYEIRLESLDFDFGDMYDGTLPKSTLGDYYAEFIVYDTQGDSHKLNLIHINK